MDEYPISRDVIQNNKEKFVEFLKHQANIEWGGYRLYDGTYNHLQQIPPEFTDFICYLLNHEQDVGKKLQKFLEIGFSSGMTNTILDKIFHFKEIVAIDSFEWRVNNDTLYANLKFKNLTLICGESTSEHSIKLADQLGPYDLLFIDGNHSYDIVKKDFENYNHMISPNGLIAFHDIQSENNPGVSKLWNEIVTTGKYDHETFICVDYPMKAGIGILKQK